MRYILEPGRSITLPAQLLVVRVQARGSGAPPRLEALRAGTTRPLDSGGIGRGPGMLALGVAEPTTIRITPPGGAEVFPPHTIVTLSVGAETPDASSVTLPAVDASGLRQRDLVSLTPAGDEVVVSAVVESRDVDLPPLAAQARVAAREILAVPTVPAEDAVTLRIVLDTSASMRPLISGGAVERVLELVMGAAQVICSDRPVEVAACGQSLQPLPPQPRDSFARPTVQAAAAVRPCIGFRSRLVPRATTDTLTFVVTDAVPADAPSAAAAGTGSGLGDAGLGDAGLGDAGLADAGLADGAWGDGGMAGAPSASPPAPHLIVLSTAGEPSAWGGPPPAGRTYVSPDLPWDHLHQHQVTQLVASLLGGFRGGRGGAA